MRRPASKLLVAPPLSGESAMKSILVVALVVAVASIALSQEPVQKPANLPLAPAPAPAIQEVRGQIWEYKVTDRGGFNAPDWEKKLNDMAKEGWELDEIDQADAHYIFRRRFLLPGPVGGGGQGFF